GTARGGGTASGAPPAVPFVLALELRRAPLLYRSRLPRGGLPAGVRPRRHRRNRPHEEACLIISRGRPQAVACGSTPPPSRSSSTCSGTPSARPAHRLLSAARVAPPPTPLFPRRHRSPARRSRCRPRRPPTPSS